MTQPREALVVEDLHKSFGGLEVLKGISMTAHEHDVVSILGSSSSGKSTFLRYINLLEIPNAGNVSVQGELIRMRRGAISNTPHGEVEAARSVGMSCRKIYFRIVLPSAFRRALPAYGNEVIFMLHGSALARVITLVDLFGAARIVNSRHFVPFESFIAAGAFYLCLTFLIAWLFKPWERRWHAHLRARDVTDAPPEPQATFSSR